MNIEIPGDYDDALVLVGNRKTQEIQYHNKTNTDPITEINLIAGLLFAMLNKQELVEQAKVLFAKEESPESKQLMNVFSNLHAIHDKIVLISTDLTTAFPE